jgi:lysozyme family protein
MPSAAFDASLPFVLRWEGGFVDHPDDPGGATNRGITQGVYDAWRVRRGLAPRSVRQIEDDEVEGIYETGYWIPPSCDLLPRQLDLLHFDTAVNMGVQRAVRFLQGAVGCPVDGDFGPLTKGAVAGCDVTATKAGYCEQREAYYRRLVAVKPRFSEFLQGWLNRVAALRREIGLTDLAGYRGEARGLGPAPRIPDVGVDPDYDV